MSFFSFLLDLIAPLRSDFVVVKSLKGKDYEKLPRGPAVYGMQWVSPLFQYKDSRVKAIIWELKYRNNTQPLEYIGQFLYEEIQALVSDILLFDADAKFLLIPIPITPDRRRERGYNQAEYISRSIVGCDKEHILLYAPQWFEKIKETPRQSRSSSREERMRNLVGTFKADEKVAGQYVILIDDVVTTGSTLSEARSTLLGAGAKDVYAFTIAH